MIELYHDPILVARINIVSSKHEDELLNAIEEGYRFVPGVRLTLHIENDIIAVYIERMKTIDPDTLHVAPMI